MDPLGLLAVGVALAVFPAGLTLAACAALAARASRAPLGPAGWTGWQLAAAALVAVAVALLPLPGSPATTVPPDSGTPANLLAIVVLLAVGVAAAAPGAWSRRRAVAAVAVTLPLLALTAISATLATATVSVAPLSTPSGVARLLTGLAVLAAAPVLVDAEDVTLPRGLRMLLLVAAGLLAAVLVGPAEVDGWRAAAVSVAAVVGAGAYAAACGSVIRGRRTAELATLAAAAIALGATVAVLLPAVPR